MVRGGPIDLSLCLWDACDSGDNRHAQTIMNELGIKRLFDVPQSLYDSWWFLGCTKVPDILPKFLSVMTEVDPSRFVGFGLSENHAEALRAYRASFKP